MGQNVYEDPTTTERLILHQSERLEKESEEHPRLSQLLAVERYVR